MNEPRALIDDLLQAAAVLVGCAAYGVLCLVLVGMMAAIWHLGGML